jgi:uncharacterized protein YndB with AHSA1/START domain
MVSFFVHPPLSETPVVDIIHRIGIKSPTIQVYKALTSLAGLAHWWTEEVKGDDKLGGKIEFSFKSPVGELVGKMVMEVTALNAPNEIRWLCVDGPADWIGTDLTFQLSLQDNQTILLFGHRNWREATESMAHCSMKWGVFLLSLREYVETGKGKRSPHDLKIDNWN